MKHRVAFLIPLIALLAGLQRRSFLETPTGSRTWQFAAGVHATAAIVAAVTAAIIARKAARRPHRKSGTPREPVVAATTSAEPRRLQRDAAAGLIGLAIPAALTAWASGRLGHSFVLLALLVPLLVLRDQTTGKIAAATVTGGVALLALGKVAGLGLGPVPAAYFLLTVGGTRPGSATGIALLALLTSAVLTARLLKTLAHVGNTPAGPMVLLLPGALLLPALAAADGYLPTFTPWTFVAGAATTSTIICATRLSRTAGPRSTALALAAGALPVSFVTARFNDVPLTTPMRIGAGLVIVGAFLTVRTLRRRRAPGRTPDDRNGPL